MERRPGTDGDLRIPIKSGEPVPSEEEQVLEQTPGEGEIPPLRIPIKSGEPMPVAGEVLEQTPGEGEIPPLRIPIKSGEPVPDTEEKKPS